MGSQSVLSSDYPPFFNGVYDRSCKWGINCPFNLNGVSTHVLTVKNGLPEGVNFDACDFWRPPMNNVNAANNVVGALQFTVAITDGYDEDVDQDGITKVKIVNESSTNVCIKRKIEFPNLKIRQQLEMEKSHSPSWSPIYTEATRVKIQIQSWEKS